MMLGPDISALIEECNSEDSGVQTRAMMALEKIGTREAVDTILPLLESADDGIRSCASSALGQLGDERIEDVGPALEARLSDLEWSVRNAAAEAIGLLRYRPARRSLEDVLQKDLEWVVRASAAWALGELGDAGALSALQVAIDDEVEPVRAYVATAIAQLGQEAQLPVLQRRLAIETHPTPRATMLELVLRMGDEPAFDNLLAFVRDVDSDFAYEALNLINDLLSKQTPAVVVARAAELHSVLAALVRRTGGGAFALEVQARLAALAQPPAPGG